MYNGWHKSLVQMTLGLFTHKQQQTICVIIFTPENPSLWREPLYLLNLPFGDGSFVWVDYF